MQGPLKQLLQLWTGFQPPSSPKPWVRRWRKRIGRTRWRASGSMRRWSYWLKEEWEQPSGSLVGGTSATEPWNWLLGSVRSTLRRGAPQIIQAMDDHFSWNHMIKSACEIPMKWRFPIHGGTRIHHPSIESPQPRNPSWLGSDETMPCPGGRSRNHKFPGPVWSDVLQSG